MCFLSTHDDKVVEELDGFSEVASLDGHNQVDGIEVLLTQKAPGQVGLGVDR